LLSIIQTVIYIHDPPFLVLSSFLYAFIEKFFEKEKIVGVEFVVAEQRK